MSPTLSVAVAEYTIIIIILYYAKRQHKSDKIQAITD